MINNEEFAVIHADFLESPEFLDLMHWHRRGIDFVCHHNAYLVALFLQRRGHKDLRFVSGYYQCHEIEKCIHHSWISFDRDGKTLVILELDPKQLFEAGGYEDDPMPSGYVPELSMNITGTATIVDPNLVGLSAEKKESPWVICSEEVLFRYIQVEYLTPDVDFADLDEIWLEVMEEFDLFSELPIEYGSE